MTMPLAKAKTKKEKMLSHVWHKFSLIVVTCIVIYISPVLEFILNHLTYDAVLPAFFPPKKAQVVGPEFRPVSFSFAQLAHTLIISIYLPNYTRYALLISIQMYKYKIQTCNLQITKYGLMKRVNDQEPYP